MPPAKTSAQEHWQLAMHPRSIVIHGFANADADVGIACAMSGLLQQADIITISVHVSMVPTTDSCTAANGIDHLVGKLLEM
jgi:hypothetical protein